MEVHAHAHTPRKKISHYFWEFLMLFLAVFCGFMAENQREHYIEHQREKQFIKSLISDVKTDTTNLKEWIKAYDLITRNCDTVMLQFDSFEQNYSDTAVRNFFCIISGFPDFIYTDRTIQQLKNSGGMRLIRQTKVADSIIAYDAAVRDILIEEEGVDKYYASINDITDRVLSFRKLDAADRADTLPEIPRKKIIPWIKYDHEQFEYMYNLISAYRAIILGYNELLVLLKERGGRLLGVLQKAYHME